MTILDPIQRKALTTSLVSVNLAVPLDGPNLSFSAANGGKRGEHTGRRVAEVQSP